MLSGCFYRRESVDSSKLLGSCVRSVRGFRLVSVCVCLTWVFMLRGKGIFIVETGFVLCPYFV